MLLDLEVLGEFDKQKKLVISEIKKNFDLFYTGEHDDLEKIIKFINLADNTVNFFYKKIEQSIILNSLETRDKQITALRAYWASHAIFNQEKADKWFINALILVVMKGYEFRPPFFIKGDEKILTTKIVRTK